MAVDAYRTDLLPAEERGIGTAVYVAGWRIALLVSGSLSLILVKHIGWNTTYFLMALPILIGLMASIFGPELTTNIAISKNFRTAIIEPFKELLQRPQIELILLFIIFFKLAEAFTSTTGTLMMPFLLNGVGFETDVVGIVHKGAGLITSIIGMFVGGYFMARISLYRALMIFGFLQAVSNLSYAWLAVSGANLSIFIFSVVFDNFSAGLGMAAIIAYIMSLCDRRYTATQFAIFTALALLGRVVLSPAAAWLQQQIGWPQFFVVCFFLALPALLILKYLHAEDLVVRHETQ